MLKWELVVVDEVKWQAEVPWTKQQKIVGVFLLLYAYYLRFEIQAVFSSFQN